MKAILDWLAPNGVGTKAALVAVILAVGLPRMSPEAITEVVMLAVTGWLVIKAANGSKNGGKKDA